MTNGFDLTGRTILITGASSGIGANFGKTLAGQGARVVLAARRKDKLEALKSEIIESGGQAMAVSMDVADEKSVIAAFDQAEAEWGVIDSIIANAGRNANGHSLELTVEDFDGLMAVNLRGVFLTVREGARRIIKNQSPKSKRGRIVIVSSITAKKVTPGIPAYSASKAAVVQMGKVMAMEWARFGINVNMLLPGYIDTDLTSDSFKTESGQVFLKSFPRRRLVELAELDGIINYLCADASSAITGAEFVVDDGQSI